MARERWLIDGWELTEGTYRDVSTRDGLYSTSALVGTNAQVANRRGTLWRPKTLGEGRFVLNGWIGANSRAEFETAWERLLQAVIRPERPVRYTRYLASGEQRYCDGEVTGVVAPTALGQVVARFALEVAVPEGVWRSVSTYTDAVTPMASGAAMTLTNLGPSTAPLDDVDITITGPIDTPRVAVVGSATEWVQFNGTVPAGGTLTIKCQSWSIAQGGSGWGSVQSVAKIVHGGLGPWLTIPARTVAGLPEVRLTGTGTSGATGLSLSGRRAHLDILD